MAYENFDLVTAIQTFGLTETNDPNLFANVPSLTPSPWLSEWLDEMAPQAVGINSEKARSEYIIAPILVEAKRRCRHAISLLSGVSFNVDKNMGLNGYCDFLISRSSILTRIQSPLIAVVEAKRDDINAGLGQCIAEMVAMRIFNEREDTPIPQIFGAVTTGTVWRFLMLENLDLHIDLQEQHIRDVGKILGILVAIADLPMSTAPVSREKSS